MTVEKLHFYIAILAGVIMTAVNIYLGASLLDVCIRLIIVLIVFLVVGYAAKCYVLKYIIKPLQDDDKVDDDGPEPTLTDDEATDEEILNTEPLNDEL